MTKTQFLFGSNNIHACNKRTSIDHVYSSYVLPKLSLFYYNAFTALALLKYIV